MKHIRSALANGEILVGPFSVSGSTAVVETIGYAGFDFVIIDTEHAPTSPYGWELENLIRTAYSADIAPVVRTTWNDRGQILKAMDMGAQAVIVPHVNTADEARDAVSAGHYSPLGRRSAAPPILAAKRGFEDWPDYYRRAIEETLIIPLIEERIGVENVDEIAEVEGLGGLFFGPFDLAVSTGVPELAYDPDLPELERVYSAAKRNNLPILDLAWNIDSAVRKIEAGAQMIALGTDATMFATSCKVLLAEVDEVKRQAAGVVAA